MRFCLYWYVHTIGLLITEIHHFLDLPLLFGYFQHLILILNTFLQFLADRKLKGALKNIAKVKSKDDCVKYYMELCESKVSVTMVTFWAACGASLKPLWYRSVASLLLSDSDNITQWS